MTDMFSEGYVLAVEQPGPPPLDANWFGHLMMVAEDDRRLTSEAPAIEHEDPETGEMVSKTAYASDELTALAGFLATNRFFVLEGADKFAEDGAGDADAEFLRQAVHWLHLAAATRTTVVLRERAEGEDILTRLVKQQ